MSNLIDFAKTELEAQKLFGDGDFYDGMTGKAVMELIEVFSKQNHSGMSASVVRSLFNKLSSFELISPLTGEDSEWFEYTDNKFQNKRCSHVFKNGKDGQAYDIDGKVFVEPDGCSYTSADSRVFITFPYVPKTEYIKVDFVNAVMKEL